MTASRASELRQDASHELRILLKRNGGLLLVLGKDYLAALDPDLLIDGRVEIATGPIGAKLHRVKLWSQATANADAKGLHSVSFFMPEWDDRVDPRFDFDQELWSGPTPALRTDVYAHQAITAPFPYDGMLVSLAQIKKKKGILKSGAGHFSQSASVRDQLNLPPTMRLMGDCGAFTYLHQSAPPYSPEEAARLYNRLGFDIGASVDHIVFPGMTTIGCTSKRIELTETELQERVEITKSNAQKFLDVTRSEKMGFTPMGVIQALSAPQFADLFAEYVEMGYDSVALGGLVPKKTKEIITILQAIAERRARLRAGSAVKLHLFGVMREELSPRLADLAVTSFDSASYLRKAWLRSEKNYLTPDGHWYAAIRVPFHSNPRVLPGDRNVSELRALEQASLRSLLDYDRDKAPLTTVISTVLEYDRLLARKTADGDRLREAYIRTLQERPWRECPCPFCKKIGIHVVIFRGINRNRRRGFHNLWVFKRRLEAAGRT